MDYFYEKLKELKWKENIIFVSSVVTWCFENKSFMIYKKKQLIYLKENSNITGCFQNNSKGYLKFLNIINKNSFESFYNKIVQK